MSILFLRGCGDHKDDTVRDSAIDIGELIWYPFQFQECLVAFNDAIQPFHAFIVGSVRCVLYYRNNVVDPIGELGERWVLGQYDLVIFLRSPLSS